MTNRSSSFPFSGLAALILAGLLSQASCGPQPPAARPQISEKTDNSDIVLASDGVTPYVIYHEESAPSSVKDAATELQRVLRISTGAQFPIVHQPQERMIALGNTDAARKAGITAAALPEEGFQIETEGADLFIAGHDTKDGELTPDGGMSDGTFYGVMDFLEKSLGVRWLIATENGEHIPEHATLSIPDSSYSDAPDFQSRIASQVWCGPGVTTNASWMRKMRVNEQRQPLPLDYNHAWHLYGMKDKLKGRPELAALVNGKRLLVEECKYTWLSEFKYDTTNPALIDLFANAVIEEMDRNPSKRMWRIGPSDGGGWCECPECTALDELMDPVQWPYSAMRKGNRPVMSLSPRVFIFFNEIAKRIEQKRPGKLLGVLAYAAYTYPPSKMTEFEPNLFVMLAARRYYGYTLYREDLASEFPKLVDAWANLFPGRLGWFDYSTWVGLENFVGAPYPPGISIMKLIYPKIKEAKLRAVAVDTSGISGYGALYTYLAAKLMWDADADVDALQADWLATAYGPGGEPMGRLYALLEEKLAEYKRSLPIDDHTNTKVFDYHSNPDQVKKIHLPIFPQMEALYLEAMAKTETPAQKSRLKMFGDNLVLLHWNMRKAGWLENPEASTFYRTDEQFNTFVDENFKNPAISVSPSVEWQKLYKIPRLGNAQGETSLEK